jgi:hypothetical protein
LSAYGVLFEGAKQHKKEKFEVNESILNGLLDSL